MPAHKASQRGVAVLAFSVVLAIVAFTIVLAYSVSSTREQLNTLNANQRAYMEDVRAKLVSTYEANALTIDADATWNSSQFANSDAILMAAGVTPRWGVQAAISNPINRSDGVKYRTIAAWLPLQSETVDEPFLNVYDGTFNPCPNNSSDCVGRRVYTLVTEGHAIQRRNAKKAIEQLEQLAENAQAFFKAKTMLDPERNVSVNHFRPPYDPVGCGARVEELPCLDSPQPIWGVSPVVVQSNTASQPMTELLGMPNAPLLNPWGLPIVACNGPACGDSPSQVNWNPLPSAKGPPYTMLFQTATPWGETLRIYAVQQL